MTINTKQFTSALNRAILIEKQDYKFKVNCNKKHKQGNKNPIVCGFYEDIPVVFKYFDDRIKPDALKRKGAEAFFLRHACHVPQVPKLIMEFSDALVLSELPGKPLEELPQEISKDKSWKIALSENLGVVHANLATLRLEQCKVFQFQQLYSDSNALKESLINMLTIAQEAANDMDRLPQFSSDIDEVKACLQIICKEQPTLYKYDNNLGNILADETGLTGLIDFEECYLGTETIYIGAIFDCLHQFKWNETTSEFEQWPIWENFKSGYERATNTIIDQNHFKQIVMMAKMNAWKRVVKTWQTGEKKDFWNAKHEIRMNTLNDY